MNTVCIAEQPLEVKEWQGQRVITFKDIDRVHQRPDGTAGRNFRANRKHFIDTVDFFAIPKKELPTNFVANSERRGNPGVQVILLTESGYLMLVKSFTDDLAWDVQRALVNNYFRVSQPVQQQLPLKAELPARKMWGGHPVMTTKDLMYFLHCPRYNVNYQAKLAQVTGYLLTGKELQAFKKENGIRDSSARMLVFRGEEVVAILKAEGCYEEHKAFLREYFKPNRNDEMTDENMKFAIRQADLLYIIAKEIRDPVIKEMNMKAVAALLLNIGLWEHKQQGCTLEEALHEAKAYWKW